MMDVQLRADHSFNKYLTLAAGAHLLVIALIVLARLFGLINFSEPREVVEIESSVRVDVVAMPKISLQELKNMNMEQVADRPQPSQALDNKDQVEQLEENQDVDLDKLLTGLSSKQLPKRAKKKRQAIDKNELRKIVLEGNKLSKGESVVGDSKNQADSEYLSYVRSLPSIVRPHWKLPSYLMDQDLKCRIRIFISSNGKVLRKEIYESSGVVDYDQRALRAVELSSPLPVPEQMIVSRLVKGDVILGFPL